MNKDTEEIISVGIQKLVGPLEILLRYSKIKKLEINRVISRKRYSQLVCLLFGFLRPHLAVLKDYEIVEAMQFAVHMLNDYLNKFHNKFFEALNLEPNNQGGYSKLNEEVCKWYSSDTKNKSIKIITASGAHLFYLQVGKGVISKENYKKLKKEGTLLSKDSDGTDVLTIIFLENLHNLNTGF